MSKLRKPSLPRASKGQPAQPQPPKLDALAQINQHAAGLDIGDAEIYAAVPESASDPAVRVFGTLRLRSGHALAPQGLAPCQKRQASWRTTATVQRRPS